MNRLLVIGFLACLVAACAEEGDESAASGPSWPESDIWLAPVAIDDGEWLVGEPTNITARPGYQNQPAWSRKGDRLFYVAEVEGQTEVFRYMRVDASHHRVTDTPESEFSPTLVPGSERISVVRIESDDTQRLWHMNREGGDFRLVREDVRDVGYHAWIREDLLGLFIVGEPHRLVITQPDGGETVTAAGNVGRGLAAVPGRRPGLAFVDKSGDGPRLSHLNVKTGSTTSLATLPGEVEDFAWVGQRGVLIGHDGRLFFRTVPRGRGWRAVADLSEAVGEGEITRLALSPDSQWLAFVVQGGDGNP